MPPRIALTVRSERSARGAAVAARVDAALELLERSACAARAPSRPRRTRQAPAATSPRARRRRARPTRASPAIRRCSCGPLGVVGLHDRLGAARRRPRRRRSGTGLPCPRTGCRRSAGRRARAWRGRRCAPPGSPSAAISSIIAFSRRSRWSRFTSSRVETVGAGWQRPVAFCLLRRLRASPRRCPTRRAPLPGGVFCDIASRHPEHPPLDPQEVEIIKLCATDSQIEPCIDQSQKIKRRTALWEPRTGARPTSARARARSAGDRARGAEHFARRVSACTAT